MFIIIIIYKILLWRRTTHVCVDPRVIEAIGSDKIRVVPRVWAKREWICLRVYWLWGMKWSIGLCSGATGSTWFFERCRSNSKREWIPDSINILFHIPFPSDSGQMINHNTPSINSVIKGGKSRKFFSSVQFIFKLQRDSSISYFKETIHLLTSKELSALQFSRNIIHIHSFNLSQF